MDVTAFDRPMPDVALLDIGLPGMSGCELMAAMREQLAARRVALAG